MEPCNFLYRAKPFLLLLSSRMSSTLLPLVQAGAMSTAKEEGPSYGIRPLLLPNF